MHNRKILVLAAIVLYVGGFGMLFTTNPQKLASWLLLLPFLLFFGALFMTVIVLQTIVKKEGVQGISKRTLVLSGIITSFPIALLLLQSVGQLSIRDIVTLALVLLVASFYVVKLQLRT